MTRRNFDNFLGALLLLSAVPALFGQPLAQASQLARRFVVVLRDQTRSFANNIPEANRAIGHIVANMGPGDRLMLVEIGGGFVSREQVRDISFPEVSPAVLHPANAQSLSRAKKDLTAAWDEAERIKVGLGRDIGRRVSINVAYTDIYTPLEYVSERMGTLDRVGAVYGEKQLVMLSDLVTDMRGGLKSEGPPKKQLKFLGVKVTALFVPWAPGGKNDYKMKAWAKWFEAGGAAFEMYDEVASPGVMVLAQNAVPRRPHNPLKEAAAKQ